MSTIARCELVTKIVTYSLIILLGIAIIVVTILSVLPITEVTDCRFLLPPSDLWFTNYGGGTARVSWTTDGIHTECETTFLLRYSYHGEVWYDTSSEDFAIVKGLYTCLRLEVRVWAVNKWGERGIQYKEIDFFVIPENQPVTDIATTEIINGVLLTWSKPRNFTQCHVTYKIIYSSELGSWASRIEDSQVMIPHANYCFRFFILINLFVNSEFNSITSYEYKTEVEIEGQTIQISPDDPEEFIVKWDSNTKEDICSLEYIVMYNTLNATEPEVITTTTPEARFRFVYCEEAWLNTQIIIFNGDIINSSHGIVAATQYPETITDFGVIGLDIASSKDTIIITWQPWQIDPLTKYCRVLYQVQVTTDFDTHTYTNVTPPIEFSKNLYCFYISLEFEVFVGEASPGYPVVITHNNSLDPVQDLNLTQLTEPNTLIAIWTDLERKERCGIEYKITFGHHTRYETLRTNQSHFSFDTAYCTTTFVRIAAISGNRSSELRSATYDQGLPTSIGPVKNFAIGALSNDVLSLSWMSPEYVDQCDIIYTVTATNSETSKEKKCIGTSNCELELDGLCPGDIELVIVSSSLSDEEISGVPVRDSYMCL